MLDQIVLFITWIVLPYLAYWSYVTPSMMWMFLTITILLDASSYVVNYIAVRVAAQFVVLKARILTWIFGERIARWMG